MTTVSLLMLTLVTADANHPPSRGVLLDFTATWCGPCQQMNPIVSRLKRQGYPVRKVDVDREAALAQQFHVNSMPTFILVVDGKERNRIVGMTSEGQLKRMLAQIPQTPKPSVIENPRPSRNSKATQVQVAENPQPHPPARKSPSFTFPFGGVKQSSHNSPVEPRVIRAKLDQDRTRSQVSVEEDPLASSVRVRIGGQSGVNYGSGTIIHSQPGRTVILTCGHIFRDLKPNAKIEVDFFTGTQVETFLGKSIGYDLEGDVGLISIATDSPLPASSIANLENQTRVRQSVYSIGCGGGDPPSREDLHVTALNRYLGPDNIECTGEPLQGRSGGGLFNAQGDVVGVCVAADPRDKRGLYAGLNVIHQLLGQHELTELLPKSSPSNIPAIAHGSTDTAPHRNVAPPLKTAVAKGSDQILPSALASATSGEAEVICIVRPLNQPKSASQVVIINRASSRFVSYLTQEMKDQPVPTMHQQPHPVCRANFEGELEAPPFAVSPAKPQELEAPPFAVSPTLQTATIERYRRQR